MSSSEAFRRGVRLGLPYAAAGFVLSLSFGVLARQAGFSAAQAIVMSLIVFAGSAQFAALTVVAGGGSALAPSLPGGPAERAAQGQAVVDASWALASRGDGTFDRWQLFGTTAPQYVTWALGTVTGALVVSDVDVHKFGLDALFPTFFLALLLAELRERRARPVAVLGGLIAFALVPIAPAGVPILAASTAAVLGLRR
jgi:predicted branched-subunit amino acid permease